MCQKEGRNTVVLRCYVRRDKMAELFTILLFSFIESRKQPKRFVGPVEVKYVIIRKTVPENPSIPFYDGRRPLSSPFINSCLNFI